MADNEKPLEWIASSYKDLMALPPDVRRRFGYALSLAEMGDQDDAAKVLKGFGGALACWRSSKTMPAARIERSTR
jgi:phage-related protein